LKGRLFRVIIIVGAAVAIVALAWLGVRLSFGKYYTMYDHFAELYKKNAEDSTSFLVKALDDKGFSLWLQARLESASIESDQDCCAAHAVAIATKQQLSLPRAVLIKAFRYRYRSGNDMLNHESPDTVHSFLDFYDARTFADKRDYDTLFWFSFFDVTAMSEFSRAFGYDELQKLLAAIMYYPSGQSSEGPLALSAPRKAAFALISQETASALAQGKMTLPYKLLDGLDPKYELPAGMDDKLGLDAAVDWFIAGMKHRPEGLINYLVNLSKINNDRARQTVKDSLARGDVSKDDATLFLESCYTNAIPIPEIFIKTGLECGDETLRIYAMLDILNLPDEPRIRMLEETLSRNDIYSKYILIHRMGPDDITGRILSALKDQLRFDLKGDWGVSKMEAFIIIAKVYETFGEKGLIDLLDKELFEASSVRIAELLALLGAPESLLEQAAFMRWIATPSGSPVWWLVGKDVLPDEKRAEEVIGHALAAFHKRFSEEARGIPPDFWRPLFVADAVDPSPKQRKDPLFPLRLFGFLAFSEPYEIDFRCFWRGDKTTAEILFSDAEVRAALFKSFEKSGM